MFKRFGLYSCRKIIIVKREAGGLIWSWDIDFVVDLYFESFK